MFESFYSKFVSFFSEAAVDFNYMVVLSTNERQLKISWRFWRGKNNLKKESFQGQEGEGTFSYNEKRSYGSLKKKSSKEVFKRIFLGKTQFRTSVLIK